MTFAKRILGAIATLCVAASPAALVAARARPAEHGPIRPNVIVILADDAGYGDFGFQGSRQIATPNIDALAKSGVVFDQAYAAMPFCSPSRAALLTGRYPQRYGYEFNLTQKAPPGVDPHYMGLDTGEKTIGDYFEGAGYRTIAVGKWHLGEEPQFHPNRRGFDDFYGFLGGHSTYFADRIKAGTIQRNGQALHPAEYLTDSFAHEASNYITANRAHPFFLYLAFNAVHTPMDATAADLARVSSITDPQRRRLAAMTIALDRGVGEVLTTLRKAGIDDRTMIVFANDNGGDRIGLDASNTPLRGGKGTLLEGGIRVPLIMRFPDRSAAGTHRLEAVSLMDILPTALTVSGIAIPAGLDGRSLASGLSVPQPRSLFWRYDNMGAIRSGAWKLLRFPDRPPELYDVDRDPSETFNRAAEQPATVAAMLKELFAWEGTVEHPRWNTGTFWSQEDVRRYSEEHVRSEIAKEKSRLADPNAD